MRPTVLPRRSRPASPARTGGPPRRRSPAESSGFPRILRCPAAGRPSGPPRRGRSPRSWRAIAAGWCRWPARSNRTSRSARACRARRCRCRGSLRRFGRPAMPAAAPSRPAGGCRLRADVSFTHSASTSQRDGDFTGIIVLQPGARGEGLADAVTDNGISPRTFSRRACPPRRSAAQHRRASPGIRSYFNTGRPHPRPLSRLREGAVLTEEIDITRRHLPSFGG